MGLNTILCGICKAESLGTASDPRFIDGAEVPNDTLICEGCTPAWMRFRIDVSKADQAAAWLDEDELIMRGAVAADLHRKIRETDALEAEHLGNMLDLLTRAGG
jgi:hypothetical protein